MPVGITSDGTNLYVVDYGNSNIRKIVIATGEVTTLAGTANILGSDDGIGPAAKFNSPWGVTNDGTNLYVADCWNDTIRKIVIATGEVTTLAGIAEHAGHIDGPSSSATFYGPSGIAYTPEKIFVVEQYNNDIREIE